MRFGNIILGIIVSCVAINIIVDIFQHLNSAFAFLGK